MNFKLYQTWFEEILERYLIKLDKYNVSIKNRIPTLFIVVSKAPLIRFLKERFLICYILNDTKRDKNCKQ